MIYINRNSAIEQLQNLVDNNVYPTKNYLPDSFQKQQLEALELLKKRIFLEELIEESISFNKKLSFEPLNSKLHLTTTAEELLEVFQLRSKIYTDIGYQDECPDNITGLNFDSYDKHSAILFYKKENSVSGTLRLIFDTKNELPTEEKFSFNDIRTRYKSIGELSRFVVDTESKGLSLEFKNLFAGVHNVVTNNDLKAVVTAIKKDHYKLYSKFGHTNVEKELSNYGLVDIPFLVMSWNPSMASKFFKRAFLEQK